MENGKKLLKEISHDEMCAWLDVPNFCCEDWKGYTDGEYLFIFSDQFCTGDEIYGEENN